MKRVIDEDKIEEIKEFWQLNSHKPLSMRDIKTGVWRDSN